MAIDGGLLSFEWYLLMHNEIAADGFFDRVTGAATMTNEMMAAAAAELLAVMDPAVRVHVESCLSENPGFEARIHKCIVEFSAILMLAKVLESDDLFNSVLASTLSRLDSTLQDPVMGELANQIVYVDLQGIEDPDNQSVLQRCLPGEIIKGRLDSVQSMIASRRATRS